MALSLKKCTLRTWHMAGRVMGTPYMEERPGQPLNGVTFPDHTPLRTNPLPRSKPPSASFSSCQMAPGHQGDVC